MCLWQLLGVREEWNAHSKDGERVGSLRWSQWSPASVQVKPVLVSSFVFLSHLLFPPPHFLKGTVLNVYPLQFLQLVCPLLEDRPHHLGSQHLLLCPGRVTSS